MTGNLTTILDELARSGHIRPPWTIRPLAGNADRSPARARLHALVTPASGAPVKITIGADLAPARARAAAFASSLPGLVPREVFFTRIMDADVWGVEAIAATSLEDLDRGSASAARLLLGLDAVQARLAASAAPNDSADFPDEWMALAEATLALGCWTPDERSFLRKTLLPRLQVVLAPLCRQRRWTNGDFTSSNVSLCDDGRPVVFDAEFAALSHFFPEETVRFRRVSPLCHHHPALLEGWWKPDEPAWEALFQLRQLCLEYQENSDTYLARVAPERKRALRAVAEPWCGAFPPDWPHAERPEPRFDGEPVQLFWRNRDRGYSEENSRRVSIRAGVRQLAAFRLPGGFEYWRLDPAASQRPVLIHSLVAVMPHPAPGHAVSPAFEVEGARMIRTGDVCRLEPNGPDPQVHLRVPPGAIGVVAELECP